MLINYFPQQPILGAQFCIPFISGTTYLLGGEWCCVAAEKIIERNVQVGTGVCRFAVLCSSVRSRRGSSPSAH